MKFTPLVISAFSLLLAVSSRAADTAAPSTSAAPAPAASPIQTIDLTAFYMTPSSVFAQITSNPWRDVPIGMQTFSNVPVNIGGMFYLSGTAEIADGSHYPEQITGVKVAQTFEALYVYHCAWYDAPEGTPISQIVFNYADGTTATNKICYGTMVRDWYQKAGEPAFDATDPKSEVVWSGPNSALPGMKLRMFMSEMANPKPTVAVNTLDVVSTDGRATSCILALSAGPAGMLKVGEKQTK